MKSALFNLLILTLALTKRSHAQYLYARYRQAWLKKAEEYKPALKETIKHPTGIVRLEKDAAAFQGWKAVKAGGMEQLYKRPFNKNNSGIVVDFWEHLTGYCTFTLKTLRGDMDARCT